MKGDGFSSLTEFLICMQACLIGCGILLGILFLFFEELKASNFIFAGYLIAVTLSIIGVVWLCKLFVDFIHRKLKVNELSKYRNDYLITFGTLGIFSAVLRVFPYFSKLSEETLAFTTFVYLICSTAIYYFFVLPTFDEKCTWTHMDEEASEKFFLKAMLINLVLFMVSIRIAIVYNDIEMRKGIVKVQLGCIVPFAIFFADFASVWWGGVQLINANGGRNEVAVQPVESRKAITTNSAKPEPKPINKTVAPKPSCNICSSPYTETGIHIPRIIKECGHTICEQCAGKLLNVKCQNILVCPFCQKGTVVNGPVGTLPKNFALLEYRREVVQQ